MTHRRDAWEPQEPALDFADRTVAAALRERGARRRASSRRWIVMGAMAATLVAGAAWGFSSSPARRSAPPPSVDVAVPVAPVHSVDLLGTREPPAPTAPAPVGPSSATPSHRRAPEPERSVPGAARKVMVPQCECAPEAISPPSPSELHETPTPPFTREQP